MSQRDVAVIITAIALFAGAIGGFALSRRQGVSVAGIALIAATPLVPTVRIPGALGLSSDDVLPLLGLGLLTLGLRSSAEAPRHLSWMTGYRRMVRALAVGLLLVLLGGVLAAILNASDPADGIALLARGAGRFAFLAAIVVAVGETIRRRPQMLETAARGLAVMGSIEAALGLFAYVVPLPGRIGLEAARRATILYGEIPGRVSGTLGISPNFTGAVLMVTLLITVGLALRARGRARLVWWAVAVLQLTTLALTFSRAPLGLAIAGITVLLITLSRPKLLLPVAAVGAAIALLTPLATRFISDSTDRLALWTAALRITADHPLGGVGPGRMLETVRANAERYMYTDAGVVTSNAHNTVLLAGAEMGVLAAIGVLLLNVTLVAAAVIAIMAGINGRPRDALGVAAGLAALAFLAQGMVNNLFTVGATSVVFALLAGAFLWNAGLLREAAREQRLEVDTGQRA